MEGTSAFGLVIPGIVIFVGRNDLRGHARALEQGDDPGSDPLPVLGRDLDDDFRGWTRRRYFARHWLINRKSLDGSVAGPLFAPAMHTCTKPGSEMHLRRLPRRAFGGHLLNQESSGQ